MDILNHVFVVTGGWGFIGSRLVEVLVAEGASEVRVIDLAEPRDVDATARVRWFQQDIRAHAQLAEIMCGAHGLFHLATLPLGPCNVEPRNCLETNIVGTFNVFDAACSVDVKKIVYSSASSVYGDTSAVMDESHPLNTRSMYGASKLCGEFLLHALATQRDLGYLILRYMNVYGPGQSGGLISSVLDKIHRGQSPVIFGDGSQSFDFVHVQDVIQANMLAMERNVSGEAFNVGSGEECTVLEIVHMLLELTGSTLRPEFQPAPVGQMLRRVGSSRKAAERLGYTPRVSLADGLKQLVAMAREVRR